MIVVNNFNNEVLGYNTITPVVVDGENLYQITNENPELFFYVDTKNTSVYDVWVYDATKSWLYINGELVENISPTYSRI